METSHTFASAADQVFPPMVQLTIGNACQLACTHCAHSQYVRSAGNDHSAMSEALWRKIVNEMRQHPDSALRIFARGEPLLHADLVRFVEIAKREVGLAIVSLITNGIELQGPIAQGLIEAGLDLVEVSLDAFTEETYAKIRPRACPSLAAQGCDFELIKRNIVDYLTLRERSNPNCKIVVSIIDQPAVRLEIDDFIAYWSARVDRVIRRRLHTFQGTVQGVEVPAKRLPCRTLWTRFNVHANGDVLICYNDWRNRVVLGNLNDPGTSIAALWQHPTLQQYRREHQEGHPSGICAHCKDWCGASWDLPYERVFAALLP